ncbi:hypothetical protein TCON_0919 [Astathelohania contejeani]|uniref:Bacterial surface antigen (D15) domain-containing protein n=1 Tax=Astathelohania contejeani TaxID=164912 RepID=A0ABQ7I0J4_9MICR|nr:hypothetical protein TCON_0919 [Thelohania contejeani]
MLDFWGLNKKDTSVIIDEETGSGEYKNKTKFNIGCNMTQKGNIFGNVKLLYPFKSGSSIELGFRGTTNEANLTASWISFTRQRIYEFLAYKKKRKTDLTGFKLRSRNGGNYKSLTKEYINKDTVKYEVSIYKKLYDFFSINLNTGFNQIQNTTNSFFRWKIEYKKTNPVWKNIFAKIQIGIGSIIGKPHTTDLFYLQDYELNEEYKKGKSYFEMEHRLGIKKNGLIFDIFSKFGMCSKQSNVMETCKSALIAIHILPLHPVYDISTGCSLSIPIFYKIGNITPICNLSFGLPLVNREKQQIFKLGISFCN